MTHRFPCRYLLPALLSLAVLTPAVQAQDEEEALARYQALLEQGQQQLDNEEYEAALQTFGEALQMSQNQSPEAYVGRATAYKEMENFASAQEELKNFRQYSRSATDPKASAAVSNLSGEIYLELGALGDAIADLQEATEGDPDNPLYQFNLGKVYAMGGAPEDGRKALTKWIDAGADDEEKNSEAYRLRAQCYAQLSKFDEAEADIDSALAIDPDSHEIYALKGTILGIQEEYAAAAEAYKQALDRYEPEEDSDLPYIEAHLQRAAMLEEAGKAADDPEAQLALFAEKQAEVQRLLDALPDRPELNGVKSSALFSRGIAERLQDDLPSAVRSFTDAIDLNPGLGAAYFRRGICFFHMGEERMAIDDFDKAASIDFTSPHAALWKGRVYAALGEHYEALKAYGLALSVSDRYTDAYVNRGLVYIKLGEYDRAISDFNTAIRLQPTNGQFYYFRGMAYSLQGDHQRALRSLDMAINFDAELAGAYLQMAAELEAIGRPDLAADYRARGAELSNQVSK